jgi:hypothetical protein
MSIAGVTRELLVRYLDTWAPTALHSARGATFAQAWSGPADVQAAEAALRVFAEFADRLRGRRLSMVLVAPDVGELDRRLRALQQELRTPPELSVLPLAGQPEEKLAIALKAAGAAGSPLLSYVDSPTIRPIATGRPSEMLLVSAVGGWGEEREALHQGGFTLTAGVELVEGAQGRLLAFATMSAKSLEAFKNELWAVDEYAGVRYRDPRDPDAHLMDITLDPNPGALRREILAHLQRRDAPATVTELKRFALTDTIYRSADATRVLHTLLNAGTVTRSPEGGKLSGDVSIALGRGA